MDVGANKSSLSTFVVSPNYSMSWRENKIFIASLTVVSFSIAGGFALQGLWLILPFAGLEMLMLTWILYWSSLQATRCEVISIDADNINVEAGRKKMRHLHSFQRAWTRVVLLPPTRPHRQSRLVMRSKGKQVEIGACLNDEDRKSLAASINKALLSSV